MRPNRARPPIPQGSGEQKTPKTCPSTYSTGQRGTKNAQIVPVHLFRRAVGNKKRPKRARPSIPRGREERGRKVKGQDARAHPDSHAEILEGGVWEFSMSEKHR